MPVGQGHSVHYWTHRLLRTDPLCDPKHSIGFKPHVPLTFCPILRWLQIWTFPDPDAPRQTCQSCRVGWQLGPCNSQRPSDPVATLATRLLFQLRSSWEEKHELLCAPLLPAAGVCLSLGQVALRAACCPYTGRPLPSAQLATVSTAPITFWSLPLAPRFQGAFRAVLRLLYGSPKSLLGPPGLYSEFPFSLVPAPGLLYVFALLTNSPNTRLQPPQVPF